MVGRTLRHYEILEPLGAGGMGEVYRARDTKLDRDVAIKVLPGDFARDADRLARFEREAKLLASLNHANIATIHGLEDDGRVRFIAMELVEGETLAARLARSGRLEVGEALEVARQIAEALEAAHEKGVIHRDLKPANVMVSPQGKAKVLDFGLARASSTGAGDTAEGLTHSPTAAVGATGTGVLLGTAPYMSPEQAKGQAPDARADIWAFGCVLFELLSGRRAFQRENVAETLAAVLRDEPDWDALPGETPLLTRSLLRRCLQKNPNRRVHHMADVRIEIDETLMEPDAAGDGTRQKVAPRTWSLPAAGVAVFVVAAAALLYVVIGAGLLTPTPEERRDLSFLRLTDSPGQELFPHLSPDGSWVAYVTEEAGNRDIWRRRVGGTNAVNLTPGSLVDDTQPSISPDGERIAFRSERDGGGIFVMGATGESPIRLTDGGFNPAWSPDGRDVAFATESIEINPGVRYIISEIRVVGVETGRQRTLPGTGDAVQPAWSPDGRRIAYWGQEAGIRDIWTVAVSGGQPTRITDDAALDWNPVWSPDGEHLYFLSDRAGSMNLWRVGVDPSSGEALGGFEPVTIPTTFAAHVSVSGDPPRIAIASIVQAQNLEGVRVDTRAGTVEGQPFSITRGSIDARYPDVSPDGQWLVYRSFAGQEDLWVIGTDGSGRRQLTNDVDRQLVPRWSPNGRTIGFYSNRSGDYEIWAIESDGSGLRQLTDAGSSLWYCVWSPDGSRVATYLFDRDFGSEHDVGPRSFIFDPSRPLSEQTPEWLPSLDDSEAHFRVWSWSPDGTTLAGMLIRPDGAIGGMLTYSFATDDYEVVSDLPGSPVWGGNSRDLLFVVDGRLYRLDLQSKETIELLSLRPDRVGDYFSFGNATIYFMREQIEADIWLADLQR